MILTIIISLFILYRPFEIMTHAYKYLSFTYANIRIFTESRAPKSNGVNG